MKQYFKIVNIWKHETVVVTVVVSCSTQAQNKVSLNAIWNTKKVKNKIQENVESGISVTRCFLFLKDLANTFCYKSSPNIMLNFMLIWQMTLFK